MPLIRKQIRTSGPLSQSTVRSQTIQSRFFWIILLVWTVVVVGFTMQGIVIGRQTQTELATMQARALVDKDILYRRWNAGHGGVYVPVTEKTRPNPYLEGLATRDVVTSDGRLLTMINPAYMTRQAHELQRQEFGAVGHLTSLQPLNPHNAPDKWETLALRSFLEGTPEVSEVVSTASGRKLRLMKPLEIVDSCLPCHRSQGYKVGDIRGGLSVTLPMDGFLAAQSRAELYDYLHHIVVWLAGMVVMIVGYLWVRRSERERAEDEGAIRSLFRAVEQSPASVVITDIEGTIEWVNPRFTDVTGYSAAEAVGGNPRILKSGRHSPEFYQDLWDTISSGREWHGEIMNRRKNGDIYWEAAWISPVLTASGRISHYIAVKEDVTERKKSEEAIIRAKEAAEEASRAKSEFLANLSHEFRTPMNGIMGMAELALSTRVTPEQREYLELIRTSADSLHTLLNDLLDFSKIEAGRMDLDPVPFELRRSLGDVVHTMAFRAAEKNVELLMEVNSDLPEHLVGDAGRLRQVLINLIGNAVKFTERGEIVVRASLESEGEPGPTILFSVSDTGVGIPKDKQEAVFEAFTQADGSVTRKFGGTGLGLAICSRLVRMFGGRIWLESAPGRGSTFYFTACFGLQQEPPAGTSPMFPDELQGARALVVDDNETARRILAESLTSWGMVPVQAPGGGAALDEADRLERNNEKIELVLIDSQMPDMDGIETARRLLEKPAVQGAAIIMFTSGADLDDQNDYRDLGLDGYLSKPVRPNELLQVIRKAMDDRRIGGARERARKLKTDRIRPFDRRLTILLAEDNRINQRLTQRLLEKAGHEVIVTSNGREALQALEELTFDLVLMDIQMPEMDGVETAAVIRRAEQKTGAHLPLVALTAYAMKGDREKFLAAGFDGYLAKPIRLPELWECLNSAACGIDLPPQPGDRKEGDPDRKTVMARLGGDELLLGDIVRIFLEEVDQSLESITRAVEDNDAEALERRAHALKGSVGYFTEGPAFRAAVELVQMARARDLTGAGETAAALDTEVRRVAAVISGWL